jgi:hypothetical protein
MIKMKKQILFIQGGGDNGYEADKSLVASLQKRNWSKLQHSIS